jgi:oxygen-dependent protoporphyrinogen oxidase
MPEGMMLMAPTMILPMLRSRLISWAGKLRMAMEVFIPASHANFDESLGAFVRRRLGQEILDKIAGPLMGGIYSADPDRLSLRSTFPMFAEMERTNGSLILGMMRRKKGQPKQGKPQPMFVSLVGGVQELTDTLVGQFSPEECRLNCRVLSVAREDGRYGLTLSDGTYILADHIVFTTPTFVTATLLEDLDPVLAGKLREIRYVSTATVSLGFKRSDIKSPLNGFGFIVPATEGRRINACSWSSSKFSHRAPDDSVLMRVFIGGALAEQYAEQDEESLIQLAREELKIIMGITAEPVLAKAYRWRKASPQYEVGHHVRVKEIEQLAGLHPGLHLSGAGFYGAGIPDCVLRGTDTAIKIVKAEARANCNCSDPVISEESTHAIS